MISTKTPRSASCRTGRFRWVDSFPADARLGDHRSRQSNGLINKTFRPRPDEFWSVAERIRLLISAAPAEAQGNVVPVTISLGLATPASKEEGFGDLIKRADKALYDAKNGGRNRVVTATQPLAP